MPNEIRVEDSPHDNYDQLRTRLAEAEAENMRYLIALGEVVEVLEEVNRDKWKAIGQDKYDLRPFIQNLQLLLESGK